MGMKSQWRVLRPPQGCYFANPEKLGYGLGTANYKSDSDSPEDKELIKTVVMAIKAGYYHLDGAEGKHTYASAVSSKRAHVP